MVNATKVLDHGAKTADNEPLELRILVAEDNITNQIVVARMLKKMGCLVDVVANGMEAVKALETIPYDLVLMDCMMPEMDGLTATRTIRDESSFVRNHAIPVVALTANALEGDWEKCVAAGMNDFLAKPVRQVTLRAMLEKIKNGERS